MSLDPKKLEQLLEQLADEVLTFIEQREAEQVAYGIYDVTMTGAEVINNFQPSEDIQLGAEKRTEAVKKALEQLDNNLQIIRFDKEKFPHKWVFRSRIAETVRLLSKLRQRIVTEENRRPGHRISNSKRLVNDVKFSVAVRCVPRRKTQVDEYLTPLLNGNEAQQQAANIFQEVIQAAFPKLEMSGFQSRTFKEILQTIELDEQRGIEKGVVVTASTGAGKTYAFFLPVLAKIILERCLRGKEGVKAICIYPRVALSENQLNDFIDWVFHLNEILRNQNLPAVTIGIESGAAVYGHHEFQNPDEKRQDGKTKKEWLSEVRGWAFADNYQGYLLPFAYCVGTQGKTCKTEKQQLLADLKQPNRVFCPICHQEYPFIKFNREVMKEQPPDLLIATTESLHQRLTSSCYQYLFGTERFCAPSVVMLDEIHLQTSTAGTQVALLLRRLLARIRLGKQERQPNRTQQANLAFVGLSATIAQPRQFLSELSGIPSLWIEEVKPEEDEMQVRGAERFIFLRAEENEDTAVISTLIQTAMCVLHTMPQPSPDSELKRYRTFGFVQSLDIVGRWLYQMQDAEKVREEQEERRKHFPGRYPKSKITEWPIEDIPLFAYRFPPYNRQLFPHFFGQNIEINCDCQRGQPNQQCPFFQAGECWWILSQKDKVQNKPVACQKSLKIIRKSGSDRARPIGSEDDLIITTSALEVGYDDEALMCVIQYMAPSNVASFVQRKGRGGRQTGTRPIVVTVLSPYKATDLFLFRNEHQLTDPTFKKLPLNSQNRYLQRIHGFYAFFDWLAYRASRVEIDIELRELQRLSYQYLMEQTANASVLLAFKHYLQNTFSITDDEVLTKILSEESDGLLCRIFRDALMTKLHQKFERERLSSVNTRDLLNRHLPENLFSDINLPEVRVKYHSNDERGKPESISLALSETIPGNVTFRGGQDSTWIPPILSDDEPEMIEVNRYYPECDPEKTKEIKAVHLPMRALQLVGINPQNTRRLKMYRPTKINPVKFSNQYNSSLWSCDTDTNELRPYQNADEAGQNLRQLAHSSEAYPISAAEIEPESDTPTPEYTFTPQDACIACDSLGQRLVKEIVLHSDESDNLNMLDVRRIILGSQYTLKFHKANDEELRGVVGFTADQDSTVNCTLGYEMTTEGIKIDLAPDILQDLKLLDSTKANIRFNAIRHAFITKLTVEYQANYFAAENLADVLLTIVDSWCYGEGQTLEELRNWFCKGDETFERWYEEIVDGDRQFSNKKKKALRQLVEHPTNDYLLIFLDIYAEIHQAGQLYHWYLHDSFKYSITQAFKQVAQEVAGVEALNYVAAWTYLHTDYKNRAVNQPIWLYEIGSGGIGVMRATHNLLRNEPDRLWTTLAHKMTHCPTAQGEALLRHLLTQSPDWLAHCEDLVKQVTDIGSSDSRQAAIETLLAQVRRQLGVLVRQAQLKTLLRVFIPDYTETLDGEPLVNWKLFREINHEFLPDCGKQFGRDPSFAEAQAVLYRRVAQAFKEKQTPPYPELEKLLRIYQAEYGSQAELEIRRAFKAAVERRLLLTCRCTCPSCLDDRSGDIEAPGMSRNLLNRPLLTEWLTQVRANQTLSVEGTEGHEIICQRIRKLLENGCRAIYLRVRGDRLDSLCQTISYLTDVGIDTEFGMVWPMITDIQTIYTNELTATSHPQIEVTIRPIE